MNIFMKITLASMAVFSSLSQAELKELDDGVMSDMTGQAGVTIPLTPTSGSSGVSGPGGLTIELETQVDIGSLSYTDEGTVALNNLHLGGQGGTLLDDVKIDFDINANGDAVIQMGSLSGTNIDFGLTLDSVTTSGSGGSTTMFSNISLQGELGTTNIVVRNNGNTSTTTLPGGIQVSDSRLEFDTHFKVTDGDLNWDVGDVILLFNFAGVGIENMEIHNRRGLDTAGHDGMASVTAKLATGVGSSGHAGLAIYDVDFRADIDMPIFKIGGTSIGSVDFTDFTITNTSMVVYGH